MIYHIDNKFLINGSDFSYLMYVNRAGFLQHAYYGKKIEKEDIDFIISTHCKNHEPPQTDINRCVWLNDMPGELGFYGHGDYHEPTVVIERKDGGTVSEFLYYDYRIYEGEPCLDGMPHGRKGGTTLEIKLKDRFSSAMVILNYVIYEGYNVLLRNMEVENCGEDEINIKKAFSFSLDLPRGDYDYLILHGRWCLERMENIEHLPNGITKIQSLQGSSSHQFNPYMSFMEKGYSEESGNCYSVQLVYSGSFALTCEKSEELFPRVQGGICDTNFNWMLSKGEKFVTPQAILCYSDGGMGKMSRSVHDFIRDKIMNEKFAKELRPIVINNWEATYFNFTEEKLLDIIDEAGKLGIDTFVLDDGWFGERYNDQAGLGDWYVNKNRLPNGLTPLIERCKKYGMKFGLWFEPEMANENSDLFRNHPDYVIHKENVEMVRKRCQVVLDFSRDEVIDYVFEMIKKMLTENDISYIKWDMNRSITECYSHSLPPHRQGEFFHRYILGVYKLHEKIEKAFPDLFIEGCASGGGRYDSGMMYYVPQIWLSDDSDGYERTKMQWGSSYGYPLSTMSCHVSASPNHQVGRVVPFEERGYIASLGAFGYELDLSKITDEEREKVKVQIENYKKDYRLVMEGDLFRILNPFNTNYFCEMVVSKDKKHGYLVGMQVLAVPASYDIIVKLKGLDENKTYYIKELDICTSGYVLMNVGLILPSKCDFDGWVWHIDEK